MKRAVLILIFLVLLFPDFAVGASGKMQVCKASLGRISLPLDEESRFEGFPIPGAGKTVADKGNTSSVELDELFPGTDGLSAKETFSNGRNSTAAPRIPGDGEEDVEAQHPGMKWVSGPNGASWVPIGGADPVSGVTAGPGNMSDAEQRYYFPRGDNTDSETPWITY